MGRGVRIRRKYSGVLAVFCGLLFTAIPAVAHHSVASEYDFNKPVALTGILMRAEFINPHCIFGLEVTNADGSKTEWIFQAGPAGNVRKSMGFAKPSEMVGKTYTIDGFATKNGKPGAYIRDIKMPDGKVITMWFQERDPNGNN